MNCPAMPPGGGIGMKFRNPFRPNTRKITPARYRAIADTVLIKVLLSVTAAEQVSEDGQGWVGAPGIYNTEQGDAWRRITDAVHARGGRIFVLLWHQGAVSHPSFFSDKRLPMAPS